MSMGDGWMVSDFYLWMQIPSWDGQVPGMDHIPGTAVLRRKVWHRTQSKSGADRYGT